MKTLQDQMSTLLSRDTSVSTTITTTTPSVVSTTAVTSTAPSASLSGGIPFAQEVPSRHPIPPNYHPQPHLLPEAPLSNPIPPNGHPQPQTIPRSVSAAASNLAATLQACLAGESGYGGLTMEHLRANPQVTSQASSVLANSLHDVTPLQQNGFPRNQVNSIDQLNKATTVNK